MRKYEKMNQTYKRSDDRIKNMDLDRSGWNWCICRVCISMFSMRQKFQKLPLPEMFKAVQYSSNKDAKFCQVALTE